MSATQTEEAPAPAAPEANDNLSAKTPPAPLEAPPRRRGGRVWIALGVVLLIAACTFGYWYFFMRGIVFSDDARLSGHMVDLAPEINDRLVDVTVREGQFVHRGDTIFRLDEATQQAAMAQANASLVSAQANLAVSQAKCDKAVNGNRPEEIKAAEATLKRLQNEEEFTRLEYVRSVELRKRNTASQDEEDRARTVYDSARQYSENARQALTLMQQGSRKEEVDAAKADVALSASRVVEAQAAIERAKSDLGRCTIRAPFDGWVVRRWLDPGAMPLPGQPVVSLFDPATLRVDANIEEKYLYQIAIGDEVDIKVDAYPDLRLKGKVTEVLRATNSEFSLIPAEGVSGTFIKVTQRVPLRIAISSPQDIPLGPGLSAEVSVRVNTAAKGGGLARD